MQQYLDHTKKPFIGKKIDSIQIEEIDGGAIAHVKFQDSDTHLDIRVEGDCCSHSYFYEVVFPDNVRGGEITDIQEDKGEDESEAVAKCNAKWPDFYTEEQSVWDVLISTTLGEVRIRHINVSNGYYDGMLSYFES